MGLKKKSSKKLKKSSGLNKSGVKKRIPFKSKYKGNPFIFICAERQTDRQTDKQTDKHPQPCSENKPFGILRKDCLAAIITALRKFC